MGKQKTENEHGSVNGKKNTLQVEATNSPPAPHTHTSRFSIVSFVVTFFCLIFLPQNFLCMQNF